MARKMTTKERQAVNSYLFGHRTYSWLCQRIGMARTQNLGIKKR